MPRRNSADKVLKKMIKRKGAALKKLVDEELPSPQAPLVEKASERKKQRDTNVKELPSPQPPLVEKSGDKMKQRDTNVNDMTSPQASSAEKASERMKQRATSVKELKKPLKINVTKLATIEEEDEEEEESEGSVQDSFEVVAVVKFFNDVGLPLDYYIYEMEEAVRYHKKGEESEDNESSQPYFQESTEKRERMRNLKRHGLEPKVDPIDRDNRIKEWVRNGSIVYDGEWSDEESTFDGSPRYKLFPL